MREILLIGCGKIGTTIARMLAKTHDYHLTLADLSTQRLSQLKSLPNIRATLPLDVSDPQALDRAMQDKVAVISALAYPLCPTIAQAAQRNKLSYYDLTEDTEVSTHIAELAQSSSPPQIFVPQCGLAPGFIAIVAKHLAEQFDTVDSISMRVGALPLYPTNALKYNLTWSTLGLINEYCQPCQILQDGKLHSVPALSELESLSIDGTRYEAFHTSGGVGSLCSSLLTQARHIDYKTIRYPGHRDLIRFLLHDLKFESRRGLLCELMENAIPSTEQDYVLSFCNVTGTKEGKLIQLSDARKIYHTQLDGKHLSAIQFTTAASLCAVVDLTQLAPTPNQSGLIHQEDIPLTDFLKNRFGKYFELGNTESAQVTQPSAIIASN
ncbi:saccharopine dehydrogenase family protein [Rubritalea tangerina]|uniref:Saccharopine dehydrogenase family protein n=1 Tax=Rubritalea tangerina TaxID=430798 RepID=A0ABW4Z7F8_9BACT